MGLGLLALCEETKWHDDTLLGVLTTPSLSMSRTALLSVTGYTVTLAVFCVCNA
jgi:hypothetical protein